MAYTPLDDGLPFSTVNLAGGPTVLAVWSLILADKDRDGITKLNPDSVARLWASSREPRPLEDVQAAWDFLAAPDAKSKNPAEGGCRIIPTGDGRWRVVSAEKYRERYSQERRRKQNADAQRRHRDRGVAEMEDAWGSEPAVAMERSDGAALQLPDELPTGGDSGRHRAGSTPAPTTNGRTFSRAHTVLDAKTGERRDSYVGDSVYPTRDDRRAAETEANELARKIADGRHALGYVDLIDPVAVIAFASTWRDSTKLKADATMTNDRLWHTINNPENGLRAAWREVQGELNARGMEAR